MSIVIFPKDSGGGGGVTVHNELTGRDTEDSHPIDAITGLATDLLDLHSHTNKASLDDYDESNFAPATVLKTQTSLALNGNDGNYFICSLNADASFSFSNIVTGVFYYVNVINTKAGAIEITMPNTADYRPLASDTVAVGEDETIEFALMFDGTKRYWQISELSEYKAV